MLFYSTLKKEQRCAKVLYKKVACIIGEKKKDKEMCQIDLKP